MADKETRLKIVIPVEEDAPYIPEQPHPEVRIKVRRAGHNVLKKSRAAAERAWRSEMRKKTTAGVRRGSAKIATKSSRFVRERVIDTAGRKTKASASIMASRIRSTDWKGETQTRSANGLRWLSRHLERMADRFTPAEPTHSQARIKPNGE